MPQHSKFSFVHSLITLLKITALTGLLAACGGGGGGGGTDTGGGTGGGTGSIPGNAPSGVTAVDSSYAGRWGWRGSGTNVGADGPRSTGVHAWGTPVAVTNTSESRGMVGNVMGVSITNDPINAIGAEYAYSLGIDGSGVKVAVVDSHILGTHTDLNDNYQSYYDASGIPISGAAFHGTHVAGILAAEKNGSGMHGVAYGVDLYGISFGSLSGGGLSVDYNKLATATNQATAQGVRIFNNSWGTETFSDLISALDNNAYRVAVADAIDQGAVFVWAAGNDYAGKVGAGNHNTSQEGKAALRYSELEGGWVNVINLAWNGSDWVISNQTGSGLPGHYDSQICGLTMNYCLGAPGSTINSTIDSGGYATAGGTSMAAPTVSGGLALLFQAFPYVETSDILTLMFNTATDLGAPGVDAVYGHGMMNLEAALRPSGSANIPTSTSIHTNTGVSPTVTSMIAEPRLFEAVSTAASDMIMLDGFDRAFVVGAAGLSEVQGHETFDALSLSHDLSQDLHQIASFGLSVSDATLLSSANQAFSDTMVLSEGFGLASLNMNAVLGDDQSSAEMRLVSSRALGGWEVNQSVGVLQEQGQLFGNAGSGAYALADQVTTVSVGSSGTRDLGNGAVFYAGLGLNRTDVQRDAASLFEVSDLVSASLVVGMRMEGIGAEQRGSLSVQVGQERRMLSGDVRMRVPVGRQQDGVITFNEVDLGREALDILPAFEVTYAHDLSESARYTVSSSLTQEETVLAVDLLRSF